MSVSTSNNNSNKPMQLKLLKWFVEWIFDYGMNNTSLVMTTYYLWVCFLTTRESKSCTEDSIYLSFYLLLSCIRGIRESKSCTDDSIYLYFYLPLCRGIIHNYLDMEGKCLRIIQSLTFRKCCDIIKQMNMRCRE